MLNRDFRRRPDGCGPETQGVTRAEKYSGGQCAEAEGGRLRDDGVSEVRPEAPPLTGFVILGKGEHAQAFKPITTEFYLRAYGRVGWVIGSPNSEILLGRVREQSGNNIIMFGREYHRTGADVSETVRQRR